MLKSLWLTLSRRVEHEERWPSQHHLLYDDGEAVDVTLIRTKLSRVRSPQVFWSGPQQICVQNHTQRRGRTHLTLHTGANHYLH